MTSTSAILSGFYLLEQVTDTLLIFSVVCCVGCSIGFVFAFVSGGKSRVL